MSRYQPATQPTFYFIGVTTAKSSIMRVFPAWARHLGLKDAVLKGIDFPLHLIEYAEHERRRGVTDPVASARRAVGPAIVIDSIVVGTGFGVLVFSQVPANARLGALVAISVFASCVSTLLIARERRPVSVGQQAVARVETG